MNMPCLAHLIHAQVRNVQVSNRCNEFLRCFKNACNFLIGDTDKSSGGEENRIYKIVSVDLGATKFVPCQRIFWSRNCPVNATRLI